MFIVLSYLLSFVYSKKIKSKSINVYVRNSILFKMWARGRKEGRKKGRWEGENGATASYAGSVTNLICCFKEHQSVTQQA